MTKPQILLVDDQITIRFTFHVALETAGYGVDLAASPHEAIARVALRAFDLIILDLRLGTESGLELLADLRAAGVRTPVLIITAFGTPTDAVEAMRLGAIDFLHKPLSPEQLRAAVEDILKRGSTARAADSEAESCDNHVIEAKHAINCRDFAVARNHLSTALELDPECADAHYLMGALLEVQNNTDAARRYYKRALDLYAGHSFAAAQLKRLERSSKAPANGHH